MYHDVTTSDKISRESGCFVLSKRGVGEGEGEGGMGWGCVRSLKG